jgi:hypothetical protein
MHPLIKRGEMQAPGMFANNLPIMTMMGFLILYLVLGLLISVLYEAWA